MKKIISVVIACMTLLAVFYPSNTVEAKSMKNADFKLPDLTNEKVLSEIFTGTYSYHGIKMGMKKNEIYKKWGTPVKAKQNVYTGPVNSSKSVDYTYGNRKQVVVTTSSNNVKASSSQLKVETFQIKDNYKKYEMKKVNKLLGFPREEDPQKNMITEIYGSYQNTVSIAYKKSGKKWYAYEIRFSKNN